MKRTFTFLMLGLFLIGAFPAFAQPFTLDKEIQPIELKLTDDTRSGHEGEKGIVFFNRITDSTTYHYATGHTMFQMVDVLVTSIDGSPLKVSLNQDIWNDDKNEKQTNSSPDNTVNFKLRAQGSFGIKIETDKPSNSLYSIAVIASPEKKGYLGSAFRKIKKSEMKSGGDASPENSGDGESSNTMLYILLGVAVLVIAFLAGRLLGNKSKKATIILWLLFTMPFSAYAQGDGGVFLTMAQFEDYKTGVESTHANLLRKLEILESERSAVDRTIGDINANITKIRSAWTSVKALYSSYTGLSSCLSSTPPAGSPTIPSICTDLSFDEEGEILEEQDEECASCFMEARRRFNQTRYVFEQLATIYKCTKKFTDAAIAFGDNTSGVHGVAGMAWQAERIKIEKSVEELQAAYDNKYNELIQSLADDMMELNICEAKFGVEDWYDRFGYMYFEFMKEKYQRKD